MPELGFWVPPLLAIFWFALAWNWMIASEKCPANAPAFFGAGLSPRRGRAVLALLAIALVGVLISAPTLQTAILSGYPGDSLFTLEPAEIAGVILISLTLIILFFWLLSVALLPIARTVATKPAVRPGAAVACLAGSLLLFGVSHTVSPQIYYTFYRWIIPGLPDQWVIRTWLDVERLAGAAALAPEGSLSAHLTGVTIWCVTLFVVWIFMMRWKNDGWQVSPIAFGAVSSAMLVLIRVVSS